MPKLVSVTLCFELSNKLESQPLGDLQIKLRSCDNVYFEFCMLTQKIDYGHLFIKFHILVRIDVVDSIYGIYTKMVLSLNDMHCLYIQNEFAK